MAHERDLDTVVPVKGLFKREDHDHLRDVFLDQLDAFLLPGPELGADKEDDGYP